MKIKLLLVTVILMIAFYGQAFAACGSCEAAKSSCSSGACGITEDAHAGHDHPSAAKVEEKHDENDGGDHSGHAHAAAKVEEKHSAATVNTLGLKTLLNTGVPLVLLDARSGKFDDGMRIAGAKSLNANSKPAEIAKIIPNKEALVVTYCSNLKCPASDQLYKHLKSLGYSNVIEYPEGIKGWKDAGNQVKLAK